MKTIFFLLPFLFMASLTAKKAHPGPCPKAALYIVLRQTPVIVYGKFIALDANTGYTLQVEEVLKGEDIPNQIKGIRIEVDKKAQHKVFNSQKQRYGIHYLSKSGQNMWVINHGYCSPRQLSCDDGDCTSKKISLGMQSVSFANFHTGLALFMQNYDTLIAQKAKGKKMVAPKNMKNATYRYLVNDMNSPDSSKY